mmetsp:Transcript_11151/g.17530  ORF Transcript_11151/g.17530 Transcript_11151/m.17530 type:complete len:273 (+) Transcript_11151:241-1059(+)
MVARTTDVVSRAVKDEMIAKDQGAKVRERSSPEPQGNGMKRIDSTGSIKITRTRKSLHLLRKVFHALAGVAFVSLYELFLTREQTMLVFGVIFVLLGSVEIIRVRYPKSWVAKLALRIMGMFARNYEKTHASGMIFFVMGFLIVVGIFPKKIAVLSTLFLSIGDPCASAAGISYGYLGPRFSNGKSLVGVLGGTVACAITAYLYYVRDMGHSSSLLLVSIIGGLAGSVTEALCGRKIDGSGGPIDVDDNLAVPVGSGLMYYLCLVYFFPSFL